MTEERILVRASFRKQVSDGNYGTEAAEITLEDYAVDPDDQSSMAETLLNEARTYVQAELARSLNGRVRQTVEPIVERAAVAAPDKDDF